MKHLRTRASKTASKRSFAAMLPMFWVPGLWLVAPLQAQNTVTPSRDLSPEERQIVRTQEVIQTEESRAIVRYQDQIREARSLMAAAEKARSEKNLAVAYEKASSALTLIPSGTDVRRVRNEIVSRYTPIALAFARELIQRGYPLEAETVAKMILEPSVNPGSREAVQLLSDLEQPEVFNKSVTPKFAAEKDQVVILLREATQLEQSGRHDLALKQYEAVLRIDPYNNAARKGMEGVNNAVIKYADEAYNETRSRMLWQVTKAWERPPRKPHQGRSTESVGRQQDISGTDQIVSKLNSIIIPKIDLNDSTVTEAVEYLKQKSREQDPSKKGVNIFLKLTSQAPAGQAPSLGEAAPPSTVPAPEPHISLNLTQVPLFVALDYVSRLSNLKIKIDPYAVSIVPLSEPTDIIVQKEYQVPPNFIPPKPQDGGTTLPQAGDIPSSANAPRIASRYDAKEYLSSQDIPFPPGSSANYIPSGSKLIVRNTRDAIDQIDQLVDAAMGVTPSQVEIQTKFLEINQNDMQELGFDWLLGPFSIGGGMYGSGGGNPTGVTRDNYPFANGNDVVGRYPVGSLRSGDRAISQNSLEGIINSGKLTTGDLSGPGIFSIAGIFTDAQFQLVIKALNQKKGVDLMSAPKVTTKSGVKASVKIVNEFPYPTQYDPPQLPQSFSNTTGIPPTVTPAFPRSFKNENLGVMLDALPTIGPDGYTIDLELNPKVEDFDGFINYGSPINAVGFSDTLVPGFITPFTTVLTTNTINQPVFTVREINTFVTVWDGQTIALGGLIREDTQKVQDKVPFLGDMPLAGRLFRSDIDQKIKKNLVIFVTPRILNADGEPRRGDSEEPEIVKPLGLPDNLPQPDVSRQMEASAPEIRTK